MTTRDLLETASLDALGLLDDQERAEFETSFRAASPEVQAQIRKEQLRFATLDDLLPNVEAPAGLRARVMAAVREAIVAVTTPTPADGTLARIGSAITGRPLMNTAPVWRAACIGFATASVVLSLFFIWMSQETRRITALTNSDQIAEYFQQNLGADAFELLASGDLRQVAFVPAAMDLSEPVSAQLFIDTRNGEAVLFCKGLPKVDGTYRLTVAQPNGTSRVLRSFQNNGGVVPVTVESVEIEGVERMSIEGPTGRGAFEGEILSFDGA